MTATSHSNIKERHIGAWRDIISYFDNATELSEARGAEDTLLFLVVLLPSLIVAQGNTHAAEETVACCKMDS